MVKKWFSVEGNIGSGKSTFCKLFAEKYNNIDNKKFWNNQLNQDLWIHKQIEVL